jgi:hypothetical protein
MYEHLGKILYFITLVLGIIAWIYIFCNAFENILRKNKDEKTN